MGNEKVTINGIEYHFIEILPPLDTPERCVLCADDQGGKYICGEKFWRQQTVQTVQAPGVNTNSSAQEKIALFQSIFRRRDDFYARRFYSLKTEKSVPLPGLS